MGEQNVRGLHLVTGHGRMVEKEEAAPESPLYSVAQIAVESVCEQEGHRQNSWRAAGYRRAAACAIELTVRTMIEAGLLADRESDFETTMQQIAAAYEAPHDKRGNTSPEGFNDAA